jgi:hypothetical protein
MKEFCLPLPCDKTKSIKRGIASNICYIRRVAEAYIIYSLLCKKEEAMKYCI